MQGHSFKTFLFWKCQKNHKYYLVAEESTTALRRQQTQLNLENKQRHIHTHRHMDFFYSSDILLKNVLTVGISERQRCMSRGVGRCSSDDHLLKWWLKEWFPVLNTCLKYTNTKTSIDVLLLSVLLSPPYVPHLWRHDAFTVSSFVLLMVSHLKIYTQSPISSPSHVFWIMFHKDEPVKTQRNPSIYQSQPKRKVKEVFLSAVVLEFLGMSMQLNLYWMWSFTHCCWGVFQFRSAHIHAHISKKAKPNLEYINQVFNGTHI